MISFIALHEVLVGINTYANAMPRFSSICWNNSTLVAALDAFSFDASFSSVATVAGV